MSPPDIASENKTPLSRRDLLSRTSALAVAAPLAGGAQNAGSKLKVIVTGGHPGDPEYGCGGTIARYTDVGHDIDCYEVSSGEDTVQFSPTHYVNITENEPRKRLACYAHASQNPNKYYALQEQVTRMRGIESGHRHAEGYIRHVQSPDFTLPRAAGHV